jgi:hypothetical protein
MESILANAVTQVLELLLAGVAAFLIALIKKKIGTENMVAVKTELENKDKEASIKGTLANQVVLYTEQVLKSAHGQEKYNAAAGRLTALLGQAGIKTTPIEIETFIEGKLKELKADFETDYNAAIQDQLPAPDAGIAIEPLAGR